MNGRPHFAQSRQAPITAGTRGAPAAAPGSYAAGGGVPLGSPLPFEHKSGTGAERAPRQRFLHGPANPVRARGAGGARGRRSRPIHPPAGSVSSRRPSRERSRVAQVLRPLLRRTALAVTEAQAEHFPPVNDYRLCRARRIVGHEAAAIPDREAPKLFHEDRRARLAPEPDQPPWPFQVERRDRTAASCLRRAGS